jgi:hypothetical protein
MKSLMLLVFLSGAGLLVGQSANDSAPEPKFSELSDEDCQRLAGRTITSLPIPHQGLQLSQRLTVVEIGLKHFCFHFGFLRRENLAAVFVVTRPL